MNPEVFVYLGLLRFPEQLERSVALLPEELRSEVAGLLEKAKVLPRTELVEKWSKLRETESASMSGNARERFGVYLGQLPPVFRDWIASRLVDEHG